VIDSQIIGKATPGGVHFGRFTSNGVGFPPCASRFGRLESMKLKILDLSKDYVYE
jgi:hypothetical protein